MYVCMHALLCMYILCMYYVFMHACIIYVCMYKCMHVLCMYVCLYYVCMYACITYVYRVSHELRSLIRESVPYVKIYRYNPKHLYPKLNGYGDNGQRSLKL